MSVAIVTGSAGLIGGAATRLLSEKGFSVVGIDNDMRSYFFGPDASTQQNATLMSESLPDYIHENLDIRNVDALTKLFSKYSSSIKVVIHTAAQPSHDWAAKEPFTDFSVNATGTLNLLEMCRLHCPEAAFVFTSTNKVYGDRPNYLPLIETEDRWEIDQSHQYFSHGIDESMSIDSTKHSLFGASKVAADIIVQEYGQYFGMNTVCFRGGCLTGPDHAGAELHGFLSYLVKCTVSGKPYTVFGYKGKQVRDNIHCDDLVNAFWEYIKSPKSSGPVYNIGGSRYSNCSMLEAIRITNEFCDKELDYSIVDDNRIGDHIWWISDIRKFQQDYPNWKLTYDVNAIIHEIVNFTKDRG